MPGKTFEPTKRGVRQLIEYLNQNGKGTTVYTRFETLDWGIDPEKLYRARTFTHRHPITRSWITGHLSPEGLLGQEGAVYTELPKNAWLHGDPAPQVAGPLGHGEYRGYLDEAELRSLAKRLKDAPHPGTRRI